MKITIFNILFLLSEVLFVFVFFDVFVFFEREVSFLQI